MTAPLAPLPSQPAGVPWPTDEWEEADPAVGDAGLLRDMVDELFVDPAPEHLGHTHALVVVHRGRIVAERYGRRFISEFEELAGIQADEITVDTKHISWSMAKSIMHAVIGTLKADGWLELDDRPPVEAWSSAGDPRAAITWDHLLQMRSGLQWVEEYYDFDEDGVPVVFAML